MKRAKEHPKMVQQMPNMAPKWTQVEAMLASRTVLGPPKSEEKNGTANDIEKAHQEDGKEHPPPPKSDPRRPKIRQNPGASIGLAGGWVY